MGSESEKISTGISPQKNSIKGGQEQLKFNIYRAAWKPVLKVLTMSSFVFISLHYYKIHLAKLEMEEKLKNEFEGLKNQAKQLQMERTVKRIQEQDTKKPLLTLNSSSSGKEDGVKKKWWNYFWAY